MQFNSAIKMSRCNGPDMFLAIIYATTVLSNVMLLLSRCLMLLAKDKPTLSCC